MGLYDGAVSTPEIPDVELGLADAVLVDVQATYLTGGTYGEGFVTKDEKGNNVNRFRWMFNLKDDEGNLLYDVDEDGEPKSGDPIEVDTITGLQFFAKAKNPSKQVRIMKALMTVSEFEAWSEGEQAPTLKELIGRPCQVDIVENAKGYPTVGNVIAPRKRRAAGRAAVATADAE